MKTPKQIAQEIRNAINDNVNGRGPEVFRQDCDTVRHRIINFRAHSVVVMGKSLNTGKWFTLSGWIVNGVQR